MTRGPQCPPVQALEALLAKEALPQVKAHLSTCDPCRQYLEALSTEQAAFQQQFPTELLVSRHRARAVKAPTRRWWWALVPVVLAAALMVVVWRPVVSSVETVTLKGGAFSVFVRTRDGTRVVAEDDALHAQDALRFGYRAPADGFVAVLSLDATGTATALVPFDGTHALRVLEGHDPMLPGSVTLDGSVGTEWFVAVWSAEALALGPLLEQLRVKGAPPACAGCRVETLRVKKVP